MKILYLPAYFTPETAASAYLNENRNQAFADAGIESLLYVPTPCRGISIEMRKEFSKKVHRCEIMYDGKMIVHRFSMYAERILFYVHSDMYFVGVLSFGKDYMPKILT